MHSSNMEGSLALISAESLEIPGAPTNLRSEFLVKPAPIDPLSETLQWRIKNKNIKCKESLNDKSDSGFNHSSPMQANLLGMACPSYIAVELKNSCNTCSLDFLNPHELF